MRVSSASTAAMSVSYLVRSGVACLVAVKRFRRYWHLNDPLTYPGSGWALLNGDRVSSSQHIQHCLVQIIEVAGAEGWVACLCLQ